tara:strand:- start:4853 stop:5029 length:177 start_codon:yes stop_codon:yes gene_type:complete
LSFGIFSNPRSTILTFVILSNIKIVDLIRSNIPCLRGLGDFKNESGVRTNMMAKVKEV